MRRLAAGAAKPSAWWTLSSANALAALAAAAALVVLFGAAALLVYAVGAVDQVAAAREARLMQYAIATHLEDVREDLVAQGIWNDAYDAVNDPAQLSWFQPNYGLNLFEARRHDITVVFDADGRPIYAGVAGKQASLEDASEFIVALQPLVAQTRARARAVTSRNPTARGKPRQASAAAAVEAGGHLYLAAAATIVPELHYDRPLHAGEPILASARTVDRPLLEALSAQLGLHDARLLQERGRGPAAALLDTAGRPLAYISWRPDTPGAGVFLRNPWRIALFGAFVVSVGGLLVWRLRDLAREQVQARDRAEAGDRAKSEFIANMSHEIRTPLNGVLGMAQVMEASELSAVQRDRLRVMRESGAALLTLLNELLDFAKIEAGKMEVEDAPFDLDRLVGQVAATFEGIAGTKGLELAVSVCPEAQGAWVGDALRIRQVLSNLVSNAVKFTERGGVTLTATAETEGLRFRVVDTGIGLDVAQIPGLFDKFIQADASTTRRYGGTGLGLSIVRALVELMGGEVSADSRPGQGACFTVRLPLARASAAPEAPGKSADAVLHPNDGAPLRILAAEDNLTNQLVLGALLEPLGADLTLVANGREAVEAFAGGLFDVVLMDVQMPELNGLDATRAIRSLEAQDGRARTPVIALTANVMSHQLDGYRAAGMDGHLAKPVEVAELYAALDAALADRADELAA